MGCDMGFRVWARRGRAMTPELMIVLASLIAKKDRKGPKWCRKKGIGAIRREIGLHHSENVVPRRQRGPEDCQLRIGGARGAGHPNQSVRGVWSLSPWSREGRVAFRVVALGAGSRGSALCFCRGG